MKVRKQESVDAFRERILKTAQQILQEDGIEGLSIRKITQRLEYTPGIIYHYFKNKDEIIEAIVASGYGDIMRIIRENQKEEATPSDNLVNTLRAYMKGMLARKDIFLLLMNSTSPNIRMQTQILIPDIRKLRASINALCLNIECGIMIGDFVCEEVELRAQVIWCATFGVIERICKEDVDNDMQEKLIEGHVQMMLSSLQKRL